ncbi:beta subunit of citrate lyase [Marasmius fiardii PR-910]|nr:beta subunit of citrate lyase [Marasmius fiardii PR-910]
MIRRCSPTTIRFKPTTSLRRLGTKSNHETLRRSYLYVPSSSERMLEKSRNVNSDIIIYDLEDSVSPSSKASARDRLKGFLNANTNLPASERIAVRVNDITTSFFVEDVSAILRIPRVQTVVLPKVNSVQDLHFASRHIHQVLQQNSRQTPLHIVSSVESAKALWNLGDIARWKSEHDEVQGGVLSGLLFAAEDYCADTCIIRTRSRQELLYTRSQIAIAAKAFGLEAIDMVCIHYKDPDYLKDECEDGRRLGFTGKQAIHPSQVETILSTFVPTSDEITRAAKILQKMESAHASQKGAIGLDGEMIDAPMIKQAERTVKVARAAGLPIPTFE